LLMEESDLDGLQLNAIQRRRLAQHIASLKVRHRESDTEADSSRTIAATLG
jgi:hypothetical protein